jgi:competence protein ComEC
MPLVIIALFAISGVLLGDLLASAPLFWLANTLVVVVLLGLWTTDRLRDLNWLIVAAMCTPLFAMRSSNVQSAYDDAGLLRVASEYPQPAIIRVTLDRPIVLRRNPLAGKPGRREVSPWQTQMEATVSEVRIQRDFQACDGRVLIVAEGRLEHFRPGDTLEVYGSMRSFSPPTNPGERDLRTTYRRRNLHARIEVDSSDQLVSLAKSRSSLGSLCAAVAAHSRDLLLEHTSDSTGPLAIALVVGQRDFVDRETRDRLLVTGTAHLLSVSGLHLAIIVLMAKLVAVFFRLPLTLEIAWILFVCVGYVALTGGRPPVTRAALLVAALMIAIWLRRPSQPMNTLAFAALLLAFWNPMNVTAVGVQLSFLAVATLFLCGQRRSPRSGTPAIEQALEKEDRLRQLSDSSRSPWFRYLKLTWSWLYQAGRFSACVTATSIPLVWFHFHVVSPISVVTNVLLSPLLVFALASGVATVVFGSASVMLGWVCGSVCFGFLWLMDQIIRFAALIPYGHAWLPSPNPYWVAFFYAVLAGTLYWSNSKRASRFRQSWIFLWGIIAWWIATTPAALPPGHIEATFVDLGHGTSVVLRTDDEVWLYDCGRLGNDSGSSRYIDESLWSLGVTKLDGVFLSHADADHYNALPGLLKRFSVEQIITPPGMLAEDEKGSLDAVRSAITRHQVSVREMSLGDQVPFGQTTFQILHPPIAGVDGNDNANSLVLSIADGALLLPGDLEAPGTQSLIRQPRPSPGGILMAPHHGSLAMDAESVLQWARPRETVVSGGSRARRPEVADKLAITGSGVHVTANQGAVRVRINRKGKIEIRTWKKTPW